MIKIKNLVTPSPEMFEVVIQGMRLPFKSGDKSDSKRDWNYLISDFDDTVCDRCNFGINHLSNCADAYHNPGFVLGEKDKQLLLNLCKAGDPSHRKVLRQLPVICDITASLYWHKQMDQYKVGTVTQSESTMHTLTKKEFEVSDFSFDDIAGEYYYIESGWLGIELNNYIPNLIKLLNALRDRYLETKDKKYWDAINRILPQSYNQTRCWSGNYEVLVTIIQQRRGHRLVEWKQFTDYLLDNVPYLKEIVEAINE